MTVDEALAATLHTPPPPAEKEGAEEADKESEEAVTAKPNWTWWLSMIVGSTIGYVTAHYLTGANGASHGLVGLVVGGVTPLLVALIRGDDLRTGRPKDPADKA